MATILKFPRPPAPWRPTVGAYVDYCGMPARVLESGKHNILIEFLRTGGNVVGRWVEPGALKPIDPLDDAIRVTAGDAPCDGPTGGDAA